MASPALGMSKASADQSDLAAQKLQLEQGLKGSASWFVVIAGLSLVNSVLAMTGATIQFIFGLGLTQMWTRWPTIPAVRGSSSTSSSMG